MTPSSDQTSVDKDEIARFSAMADEWWSPTGKFRPLHKFNPTRLTYIKEQVCAQFSRDIKDPKALSGLRFLDIGCGGGLLCEPMARMGAQIVGVDASQTNIKVAKLHAQRSNLTIDYRADTAENLAAAGEQFDVVLNMEVVEHVSDVPFFMAACCQMVKPNGIMFTATINRTRKAQALAIFMAERVLKWLPVGTHQYEKLVKPEELIEAFNQAGMSTEDKTGVTYNPLTDTWSKSSDMDVNYMLLAKKIL